MKVKEFIEFCKNQHDIHCNQKYGDIHPYSFHLELVSKQAKLFKHILDKNDYELTIYGCWGHDLIEDARMTYNDIKNMVGEQVADIIYCCTEEKGKNRTERHSQKFFDELKENELAIFVKLCDITANVKYSLLTNSSMYSKYKKEFPKLKENIYVEKYDEMFNYLESLLNINSNIKTI
jgi:(p)ppGpp synthase/HD superfamily hydrolase